MKMTVKTCLAAASLALFVTSASALPLNITVDSTGALLNGVGVANDTQYGQSNNDPSDNLAFLNAEISKWNGVPMTPHLPTAVSAGGLNLGSLSGSTFTVPAGTGSYDYVVFHFGAGEAGGHRVSPGGWWEALYLGGIDLSSITFTLPVVGDKEVGSFSSARFFNPETHNTPDGAMTLALLGGALSAIGLLRRKLS